MKLRNMYQGLCLLGMLSLPGMLTLVWSESARGAELKIGQAIPEFSLQDFRGRLHRWEDYGDRKLVVVAFLGTECPLAKLYGPRLAALSNKYASQGVAFLGVDANRQDSITELDAYARRHELNFPLLKDSANRVADTFGAQRTPEVFVLDAQRRLQYRGRIDDQYGVGYARDEPTRQDLMIAIDELLAGRPVSQPITEAVGCHIGRIIPPKPQGAVTYSRQISRILRQHCVECHRPGEIAPFALTDYDEVVGWAKMIEEVIDQQRMPPWNADPKHGKFANARLMTDQEKQLVRQWVQDGAPRGEDAWLPTARTYSQGWRLPREPDLVLSMRDRPFQVPAEGTVEYQYFVIDPKFEQDTWVTAAEVAPGNRAVVHHAIVFVRPPDGVGQRGVGWLAAYVPGQSARRLQPGQGRLVPAGSKLVFQMHYTPNGSPQQDLTKVGLLLGDAQEMREQVITMIALDRGFEIPPRTPKHPVAKTIDNLPSGGKLLAIAPHMHLRGRSFRFVAHRDDGQEVLLNVPRYDFNWQHSYRFAEPLEIGPDLKIECLAHYDNSENNLSNPDPDATVHWGDQTDEEMFVAYFEIAIPRNHSQAEEDRRRAEIQRRAAEDGEKFIARFDRDGDGKVVRSELPASTSAFAFQRLDANRDKVITLEEARKAASASLGRRN